MCICVCVEGQSEASRMLRCVRVVAADLWLAGFYLFQLISLSHGFILYHMVVSSCVFFILIVCVVLCFLTLILTVCTVYI